MHTHALPWPFCKIKTSAVGCKHIDFVFDSDLLHSGRQSLDLLLVSFLTLVGLIYFHNSVKNVGESDSGQ